MKKRSKKGFTLIELIVVIAIVGILAAILIPQFTGFQDKARATQAVVEAKQVATAIDSIYAEKGAYTTVAADVYPLAFGAAAAPTGSRFSAGPDANGGFTWEVTVGGKKYSAGRTATGKVEAVANIAP